MSAQAPTYPFDPEVYRDKNQDLCALSTRELVEHFQRTGFAERRLYAVTRTTVEYFSMKYLRGQGLEIGPGASPAPLFGNARCVYADLAPTTLFDAGDLSAEKVLLDIQQPGTGLGARFDFVIASHVLEHLDSLVRGLAWMARGLNRGGIAYVVLPNRERDADQRWIPAFGPLHHWLEAVWPGLFRWRHERDFCAFYQGLDDAGRIAGWEVQQRFPRSLEEDLLRGRVSPEFRYVYHRHSYSFEGWLRTLLVLSRWVRPRLTLLDAAAGDERSDCHFVFQRVDPDKD